MVCGVLVLTACAVPIWGQRRLDDGGNLRARQVMPASTDATRLQWLMLSGDVGTSAAATADIAPAGTVSVKTLKVPGAAMKEMQKFFKDFDAGKLEDSVKHVSKAIQIYPQWAAAHHNLGQTYARMGDYGKAIVEFHSAAELDGREVHPWLSLTRVYLIQKKYDEGEAAARRALEIDPVNSDARYYLSRNLIGHGQETPEALQFLKNSREQYAVARLVLANVYLKHGAVSEAVTELREYLAQPDADGKEKVQCMVRRLTAPEGTVNCEMQ
jgi:tetratricopeptide (TPR) repeat protein